MDSRLHVSGNAVQPLLLMFPLGLFALAIIFDIAALTGAPYLVGTLAFWNIVAGLVGGALAAGVIGIDLFSTRLPRAARVRGFLGLLLDLGVLLYFAVIVLLRLRSLNRGADSALLWAEMLGLAAAAVGTWFGGRFGPRPATAAGHTRWTTAR